MNERALERRDARGPGEQSQPAPRRAEREAKLRETARDRPDTPASVERSAPTQREKAPKPAVAPVLEPAAEPVAPAVETVTPVPTVVPDAGSGGNGKANGKLEE